MKKLAQIASGAMEGQLFVIDGQGDFRRQAFRPSKWREYRKREREKNRASLKAIGLESNAFLWPEKHKPEWVKAKLARKHMIAI